MIDKENEEIWIATIRIVSRWQFIVPSSLHLHVFEFFPF